MFYTASVLGLLIIFFIRHRLWPKREEKKATLTSFSFGSWNDTQHTSQRERVKNLLGVTAYHKRGYTGSRIKIGIVDVRVSDHTDLKGKTVHKYNYKGCGDAHATHVCGIITNIAPNAEYYTVNALQGVNINAVLGDGIIDMVKNGVNVINMSISKDGCYGGRKDNTRFKFGTTTKNIHEIYDWLEEQGVIVVMAAGNRGSTIAGKQLISELTQNSDDVKYNYRNGYVPKSSMSSWPITTTSCRLPTKSGFPTNGFSEFNSLNKSVDIMSYGEDIWSYNTTNGYVKMSGTSMAAPQVTGCVALVYDAVLSQIGNKPVPKQVIGKYVKDFILNKCTVRDIKSMEQFLPPISGFSQISEMISKNVSNIIQYRKSLNITDNKARSANMEVEMMFINSINTSSIDNCLPSNLKEIATHIRKFLLTSKSVVNDNIQFYSVDVGTLPFFDLLGRFHSINESMRYKYTTLSLGYGILSLSSLPNVSMPIHKKEPFGYM